jgi:predicted metal-binding membrane protein
MRTRGRAGALVAFVSGYLVIWLLFGIIGYGLVDLVNAMSIDALRGAVTGSTWPPV